MEMNPYAGNDPTDRPDVRRHAGLVVNEAADALDQDVQPVEQIEDAMVDAENGRVNHAPSLSDEPDTPTPESEAAPAEADSVEGETNTVVTPTEEMPACDLPVHPASDLPVHPASDLFPMMAPDRLSELTADIKQNGLVNPIVIHDGQIVDGRNRYVACRRAGVDPKTINWKEKYTGPMSLYEWIWSENGQRRHLTTDQIVMIQVKLKKMAVQEASHQRQIDAGQKQGVHGKQGGRGKSKPVATNSSEGVSEGAAIGATKADTPGGRDHSGDTRTILAKDIGVSEYKVQQAMNVDQAAPGLADAVVKGTKRLREAEKEVKRARKKPDSDKPGKGKAAKNPTKPPIGMADAVNEVMSHVDAVLKGADEQNRKWFLKELKERLKAR
jgi:hypothetical protein